jgi:hypothetical protein
MAEIPDPILKGRFNLWETPDGGFHIAYVPDGDKTTHHFDIPGMVVRMAKMSAEGKLNPLKALKELQANVPT